MKKLPLPWSKCNGAPLMTEWPGDGDEVLVAPSLLTRHGYVYGAISIAYWDEENEQFRLLESAEYDVVSAKHWMPLPKLPEL